MTDAEIIKELEYQIEYGCGQYRDIDLPTLKEAVNLINRQQAEIERLKKENHRFADIGKMYSEIKSETCKEFAERLKPKLFCGHPEMDACIRGTIDNLLKEMG